MLDTEDYLASQQTKILNRLKRAQGQLAGVITGLENGKGCEDILVQLTAVTKALERAGYLMLSCAVQHAARAEAAGEFAVKQSAAGEPAVSESASGESAASVKESNASSGFLGTETLSSEQLEKLFMML